MLRFSASSAARLMACPGSANLEKAIPGWTPPIEDPAKFKAKGLGTQIHKALEFISTSTAPQLTRISLILEEFADRSFKARNEILGDRDKIRDFVVKTLRRSGSMAEETIINWMGTDFPHGLAPKMIRYMAACATELESYYQPYETFGEFPVKMAELEIDTTWLANPGKTTVDLAFWEPASDLYHIVDYKTGSIPVSPVDNDQLMFYAWSLLHNKEDVTARDIRVQLIIMQPGNFEEHEVTIQELQDWAEQAKRAEQRILDGDTTLRPSDHCTFCPANPHARGERGTPLCPAQMQMLYPEVIDYNELLS